MLEKLKPKMLKHIMTHEMLNHFMAIVTEFIETLLGLLLTAAVVICGLYMIPELFKLHVSMDNMHAFREYLEALFNLVIGVEALKMIYKHTPGSVIEVLVYTLARELVVHETTVVENLILIVCITILFAVRKFLFVPAFGAHLPSFLMESKKKDSISPDVQEMLETHDDHHAEPHQEEAAAH